MISNSDENTSYSEKIKTQLNYKTFALTDDSWYWFLLDHREEIIKHSSLVEVTQETLYRYRYRISDYLNEVHNLNRGQEQAFRIVNRLHNDLDFNLMLTHVYIPDDSYLSKLRQRYATYTAKQKKINS